MVNDRVETCINMVRGMFCDTIPVFLMWNLVGRVEIKIVDIRQGATPRKLKWIWTAQITHACLCEDLIMRRSSQIGTSASWWVYL
jgi:hypothetical protein